MSQRSVTVKKLSELSGVSVRTLHFYDEIGLLKPERVGENGYRYYGRAQLLRLQQILFYRELGFELKEILKILNAPDFDVRKALRSHRRRLAKDLDRTKKLIQTIDETLKKGPKMKDQDLFQGFDAKKQKAYEAQLIKRYGDSARAKIDESKKKMKNWDSEKWSEVREEWNSICEDLAGLQKKGLQAESAEVQAVVLRHFKWLHQFWTPTPESYAGLGQGYTGAEWTQAFQAYDDQHPRLATFFADAISVFSKTKVSLFS